MPRHLGQHNTSLKFDMPKDLRYRFDTCCYIANESMSEVLRTLMDAWCTQVEEEEREKRERLRAIRLASDSPWPTRTTKMSRLVPPIPRMQMSWRCLNSDRLCGATLCTTGLITPKNRKHPV